MNIKRLIHSAKPIIGILALALLMSYASADDWPQWQGPDRNAISKETGLLQEWPKAGPPLAWKAKGLGGGDSAPSVAAGRIYGMAHRGGDEIVWALSEKDGKEIWTARLAPALAQNWPQSKEGPSATPTVDGDRLYVMGLAGNVACLQVTDGKVVWQRNLKADFGGKSPMWSYRESPLIDGEKVICTPGGDETTMVALNKANGETIWKSQVPDRASGGETQNRRFENRPSVMQTDPVLSTLDADHNKEISARTRRCAGCSPKIGQESSNGRRWSQNNGRDQQEARADLEAFSRGRKVAGMGLPPLSGLFSTMSTPIWSSARSASRMWACVTRGMAPSSVHSKASSDHSKST